MENKINLAELLKDCPKGMELDCAIWDNCTFEGIEDVGYINILVKTPNGLVKLSKEGYLYHNHSGSKCVIFPKGKTTWEGFVPPCQFKDGDVIVDKYGAVAIYKRVHSSYEEPYVDFHCGITSEYRSFYVKDSDSLQHYGKIDSIRLATEEEKAKLFQAIKNNGYKWNAETKTLEKLVVPKFKVGDRIKSVISSSYYTVVDIKNDHYFIKSGTEKYPYQVPFSNEINYELVPNKFDITTLKPFDKVLVRCNTLEKWRIQLFEKYDKTYQHPFICIGCNKYKQCIPYEGNEHLLDTTDDCDEYFKSW